MFIALQSLLPSLQGSTRKDDMVASSTHSLHLVLHPVVIKSYAYTVPHPHAFQRKKSKGHRARKMEKVTRQVNMGIESRTPTAQNALPSPVWLLRVPSPAATQVHQRSLSHPHRTLGDSLVTCHPHHVCTLRTPHLVILKAEQEDHDISHNAWASPVLPLTE